MMKARDSGTSAALALKIVNKSGDNTAATLNASILERPPTDVLLLEFILGPFGSCIASALEAPYP